MVDEGPVIKGPNFLYPVPNESLGQYVYRHLLHNNKQYEAMVCYFLSLTFNINWPCSYGMFIQ